MLAAPRATALPQNLPKIIPGTKAPFHSILTSHELGFLIVPSLPRLRNLTRTTRRIGAIRIVTIAAPAAAGLKASPWSLRSTQPRSRLETIVIVAATGQRIRKIRIWVRSPIIIIIWRDILLTNVLSPVSQKTSIGLGDLLIGDWC